jgi:hypothetical protein
VYCQISLLLDAQVLQHHQQQRIKEEEQKNLVGQVLQHHQVLWEESQVSLLLDATPKEDRLGALDRARSALLGELQRWPSDEELEEARGLLERELFYIVELARLQRELQERSNQVEDAPFNELRSQGERHALQGLSGLAYDRYVKAISMLLDQFTPAPQPKKPQEGQDASKSAR